MQEVARERLKEIVGVYSPEVVPAELLRRDFELLAGTQVGHRLGKYGTKFGLAPLWTWVGEATKVEPIKEHADKIGHATTGIIGLLGLLLLRGKWTRVLSFGALFYSVEKGLNFIEEVITKAVSSPSKSE